MRHRTVRRSSPTGCRSRFQLARSADAATSVAGGAVRTPAGAPSVPNAGAGGPPLAAARDTLFAGYEVHIP